MKKLFKTVLVLLVLVLVAGGVGYFYLDSLFVKAVERGGEMALGVPTELDQAHISVWGGEATLQGLRIANPTGFDQRLFAALGRGEAAVSVGSLISDTIRVPRVRLSDITINLEQQGKKNNLQPLLARAKSMQGSGTKSSTAPPAEGSGKKFIVEYFSLENVEVNAALALLDQNSTVSMKLPKIELRNLGAQENGLSMPALVQKVVQAVLAATQNSSAQFSPALARLLKGELGDLDQLQVEVVGQARAQVEGAIKKLQDKMSEELPTDQLKKNLPADLQQGIDQKTGDLLKKGAGKLFGD